MKLTLFLVIKAAVIISSEDSLYQCNQVAQSWSATCVQHIESIPVLTDLTTYQTCSVLNGLMDHGDGYVERELLTELLEED